MFRHLLLIGILTDYEKIFGLTMEISHLHNVEGTHISQNQLYAFRRDRVT